MSRSQSVRNYLESKPDAMPKAVSQALKEEGIDAAPMLVSQVKYQMKIDAAQAATAPSPPRKEHAAKAKTPKIKAAKAKRRSTPRKQNELTANDLLKVKEIVDRLGGRQRLQEAMQILRELS
ncbi:MAG: hypothetical protein ACC628_04325 [Pirellulaceae bacterium]